jgi:hypothetical protein
LAKPRAFDLVCPDLNGRVYQCLEDDFDWAMIDTRMTGVTHISVTADPAGGYPCWSMPLHELREVKEEDALQEAELT